MDHADIWPRPAIPVEPEPSRWVLPDHGPGDDSDMVAVGADLEPGTVLNAYRSALFPMPIRRGRIGWFSPDPRGILPLDGLRVTRSLRRSLKRYTVSFDRCFTEVMAQCGDPRRESGWIDQSMIDAYTRLHRMGWAHSVEVWQGQQLVGGLYGIRINGFFAGESMFHLAVDASKVALVHLVDWMNGTGGLLLDVQWTTDHLVSLGAIDVSRRHYLALLETAIAAPARQNDHQPSNQGE